MKKFYIFFWAGFILLTALLYISLWWFMGAAALIIFFTVYHFYSARLKAMDISIAELETQVDQLQLQLDHSIMKEEKATKEAGQIRQIKQELLTIVSHEIRTPMNGVLGMSLLLADTALTTEQKEYVETIRTSGENLLGTVNEILVKDVLDFSKLDRKNKKLENIDFDLRDAIEEVLVMFGAKAGKKGVELLYDIYEDVPLQLLGDNKRLREILMNIIENAVKFTQDGEILVQVQSKNNTSAGIELQFEIHDTGTGMSSQQAKQLFYDNSSKDFNGTDDQQGHGLIICRKLTELMGGTIDVKSKPGEGTIFFFSIPFLHSAQSMRNSTPADNLAILSGKNILVIDDNQNSRNILTKQLKSWKIIPELSVSGSQALEILATKNNFDVILTNRRLKAMDGIQLARSIQKKYPHIPLLLMNPAGVHTFNAQEEPNLFAALVTKPIRIHILQDALISILKNTAAPVNNVTEKMEQNFSEKNPLHILIAEDNLINQKIAKKILSKLGYQPKIASNGKEALEMASQEKFDIVLMDVQMPEMDGMEATRMIRSNLKVQPVIMAMTANVMQGDRDLCLQAGMDDYISKPIILEELLSHLEKWASVIKQRNSVA